MRLPILACLLLIASSSFAAEVKLDPRDTNEALALDVWATHDSLTWASSLITPTSTSRTYSFWLYMQTGFTSGLRYLFRKGEVPDGTGGLHRAPAVYLDDDSDTMLIRSATGAPGSGGDDLGFTGSVAFTASWKHVVVAHGAGTLTLYIDNSQDASVGAGDPYHNTDALVSGGAQGVTADRGIFIHDLRYYDSVLGSTARAALLNAPAQDAILIPAWTRHDSDWRAVQVVEAGANPDSVPIHPDFDKTLRIDSVQYAGFTAQQPLTPWSVDGLSIDLSINFYDDGNLAQRDDWVGLGEDTTNGWRYIIGLYQPGGTTTWRFWAQADGWTTTSVTRTVGWHNLRFYRAGSGSNMEFYIDGELVGSSSSTSTTVMDTLYIRGLDNSVGYWSPWYTSGAHEIDVNPTTLDLGQHAVAGGVSASQTLTITNKGGSGTALSITGLSFTGTHAAEFSLPNAPGLPLTIGAFQSVDIEVAFDPAAEGARVATLEIASNDADEATVSVSVTGQGGEGNPLLCEVSTATDPPTRFYKSSASDTCQASPTTANSCYYPEDKLATTFPTELRIVGPNAQAPLFADPVSRLENDGTDDRIYVAFNLPTKYYNHELVFADATNCGTWTLSDGFPTANTGSLDNCFLTYEWSQVWADAYASDGSKCGWNRTVDGSNVELTLDFGIFAVEDVGDVRGDSITRNVTFAHPMTVEFPTQVTAETASVQVFSPVRTLAAVVGQSVTVDESTNPDTATLTVTLSTEVQAPFELHGITSNTVAAGITLVTTLDGGNDENVRQEAECTNGALDCANTWQIQYSTQTTTTPCNFNGGYSVDFTIRCSDESDTNCPIDDATDSVTVSFTLASSDHCPSVIDSIVLNAELKVYDAPQRVTDADDFVGDGLQDDGQTAVNEGDADQWQVAYFTAPTTSSQVAILETEFNQVWVERGAAADITLLDKDNSLGGGAVACTATAYADADDTASCGTEAGLDSTTCQLVVPDIAFPDKCGAFDFAHRKGTSAAAGENSIPWFEFDINTGASGFNLANDAIETMTVNAVIDVSYANAAKMVAGAQSTTRRQHADVSASISAGQTGTAASSSSSSATLFGMNAMVVYAGAAVMAIVAVAAIVVTSRRRSNNLTKLQSTAELTTTSTAV